MDHLLVCWSVEAGPVRSSASGSAEPPEPGSRVVAAGWPGAALARVNPELVQGFAGGLSSDHPETSQVTSQPAARSSQSPAPSVWLPTRGL